MANPPVVLEQYEWIPLEQLQLPTPPPENGSYALLAGQFTDAEAADATRRRVMALGLLSSSIPVVDRDGQHWFFVSAGRFASLDEASIYRAQIGSDLGISEPLPIILLPPEPG